MAFWPLFCCVSATGWVSCLCITAFAFTQPELARRELIQWFPWFCGLFLVGIPHGALDHRVGSELSRGVDQTPGFSAGPWFTWPTCWLRDWSFWSGFCGRARP